MPPMSADRPEFVLSATEDLTVHLDPPVLELAAGPRPYDDLIPDVTETTRNNASSGPLSVNANGLDARVTLGAETIMRFKPLPPFVEVTRNAASFAATCTLSCVIRQDRE